jgi:hypothetical protein
MRPRAEIRGPKAEKARWRGGSGWRAPLPRPVQSGRGQPHSKTLARHPMRQKTRSVLECGCPLPLSHLDVQAILSRNTGKRLEQFGYES